MNHRKFRGTMLVIAGALSLAACGSSDSPTQQGAEPAQQAAPEAAPATPAPAASPAATQPATALQEFLDPVTGQPRAPTDAELKAIAASAPSVKSSAAATPRPKDKEIVLSNGMVAVEPGVVSDLKACVQPDGRVLTDHDCKSGAAAPVKKP
jgi:glucose/arabinose dehydrogenase